MKLFISWSGERSKQIALAFRHWLPTVIQSLKPWMSTVDVAKGAEWNQELSKELEGTAFGLFCLTAENLSSPWLLFEAGAIGKRTGIKRVFTYLFDLEDSDVQWPLAQFQYTRYMREDTLQMLMDMNRHLQEPLDKEVLRTSFDRGWPDLENALKAVPAQTQATRPKDKTELMLEEILAYVREQNRREAAFAEYVAKGGTTTISTTTSAPPYTQADDLGWLTKKTR